MRIEGRVDMELPEGQIPKGMYRFLGEYVQARFDKLKEDVQECNDNCLQAGEQLRALSDDLEVQREALEELRTAVEDKAENFPNIYDQFNLTDEKLKIF